VHLVLLDNGRTQAYADEQLRKTLQCIRCGACMNHCPVYTRIGGHAYGTTYPGPIGKIISPHMLGLEATHVMATASSLCGACGEVCPVKIPIPDLLMRLREESFSEPHANPAMRGQGAGYSRLITAVWQAWAMVYRSPSLYKLATWLGSRFNWLMPSNQGTDCAAWPTAPTPASTA
jgi:L-lactate dehydrogenase complex protein LldF